MGTALFVLASLLAAVVALSVGGKPITLLIRLVFDILLAVLVVRGVSWARWVVVVLCGIGAIILGWTVTKGAGSIPAFNLAIGLAMTILYVTASGMLAFASPAREYFRSPTSESMFSAKHDQP